MLKQVNTTLGSYKYSLARFHKMDIYDKLVLVEHVKRAVNIIINENDTKFESYEDICNLKTREGNQIKLIVISRSVDSPCWQ